MVFVFGDMPGAATGGAGSKTWAKRGEGAGTKTFTAEISKLGLVEMTRQNVTEGVREEMTRPCPTCGGDGGVLSEGSHAREGERRLPQLAADQPKVEARLAEMNPHAKTPVDGN